MQSDIRANGVDVVNLTLPDLGGAVRRVAHQDKAAMFKWIMCWPDGTRLCDPGFGVCSHPRRRRAVSAHQFTDANKKPEEMNDTGYQ
jgi:hypothetical protein